MRFPEGARWWTSVPPPAPDPITITSYALSFAMPPPVPSGTFGVCNRYTRVTPSRLARLPPGKGFQMSAAAAELQALAQDTPLVEALRAGDERAFLGLVGSLHSGMIRFARGFLHSDATAEDVVQDTWAV